MTRQVRRAFLPVLCFVLLGAAGSQPTLPGADMLDPLLVMGERPGPALWRVFKEGHELWILGTLEPLPKQMIWRSSEVDARIAGSQTVIAPPQVTADVGFLKSITLLPSLLSARKSPDGGTLQQTLPHDLYMRWLALRVRYLGNGGNDEKLRPMVAALDVYQRALDASGLTSDDRVWASVVKTARQHRVSIEPVTLKLSIDDPKASIKGFAQISRAAEVACLATTIERLETDLIPMRRRAILWSLGDVQGLKALPYPDELMACQDAFFSVPQLGNQLEQARIRTEQLWLTTVVKSLVTNSSSFAVLSIHELTRSGGGLDRLRAQGYSVDEP